MRATQASGSTLAKIMPLQCTSQLVAKQKTLFCFTFIVTILIISLATSSPTPPVSLKPISHSSNNNNSNSASTRSALEQRRNSDAMSPPPSHNKRATFNDHVHQTSKKRFKTSGRFLSSNFTSADRLYRSASTQNARTQTSNSAASAGSLINLRTTNNNDLNNNNNNTLPLEQQERQSWRQNVNSINGTIDLSEYEQNDIDRLYGDALLVYFKNFNETLPARRETININGTAPNSKTPVYKSLNE